MDSITQAVLGAAFGEAVGGRRLGARAPAWGAVGGVMPDLDLFVSHALGPFGEMQFHRGPSHALWFGPVVGTLLGWLIHRIYRRRGGLARAGPLGLWIGVMVLSIITHPLLDVFTSYGTQLLSPFSDHRFALNGIGIIDPVYSLTLLAAVVLARWRPAWSRRAIAAALISTTAYLGWGTQINARAEDHARRQLEAEGLTVRNVTAYPTVFQLFLRRVVARTDDSWRIGWVTMWSPHRIRFTTVKPDVDSAIDVVAATPQAAIFDWFAMRQTVPHVVSRDAGRVMVEIDDLRYGLPDRPDRSMWGLRGVVDSSGALVGPLEKFRRAPPDDMARAVRELFRAAFAPDVSG